LRGTRYTDLHPSQILGSLVSWSINLRIPIWFCDNRDLAQTVTARLLSKAAKYAGESELLPAIEE